MSYIRVLLGYKTLTLVLRATFQQLQFGRLESLQTIEASGKELQLKKVCAEFFLKGRIGAARVNN